MLGWRWVGGLCWGFVLGVDVGGLCWGFVFGLCWVCVGVVLGLCWVCVGVVRVGWRWRSVVGGEKHLERPD